MNAKIFKPPYSLQRRMSVFLAGSIEMGTAEDWQTKVEVALRDHEVDIYNPRRDDWNSSWEQSINNSQFRTQVEWELDALDAATHILMYFDPNTKSPISLLELGLYAASNKLHVFCPDGFYRKGNVDIICARYEVPTYECMEDLINEIKWELDNGVSGRNRIKD